MLKADTRYENAIVIDAGLVQTKNCIYPPAALRDFVRLARLNDFKHNKKHEAPWPSFARSVCALAQCARAFGRAVFA